MAQAWPIQVLLSHGYSHGSKAVMESEWGPVKASEHQSALGDVMKWWRKTPSLSVNADGSHLTTTWGVLSEKWKQHRKAQGRIRENQILIITWTPGSWSAGFTPWSSSCVNQTFFLWFKSFWDCLISLEISMSVLMFLQPFPQNKLSWSQSFLLEEQKDIVGFYRTSKF